MTGLRGLHDNQASGMHGFPDDLTMTRFGDELRREREARGVGVADICAATKVSAQNVLALEAGEYRRLPGGVFRKGIVRSYLSALGLEEAFWIERFEASCREMGLSGEEDRDWVEFAQNVKKNRAAEQPGMGLRWLGVVLLMVMLWAIGWIAWYLVQHKRMEMRENAYGVRDAGPVASSGPR